MDLFRLVSSSKSSINGIGKHAKAKGPAAIVNRDPDESKAPEPNP
jgi:hypothetical protein